MSYSEVYRGGEPVGWRPYESSYYDSNSYDRSYDSARYGATSLVPVRVIERGHVHPDRVQRKMQKQNTGTYWDSSDYYGNYSSRGYDYHRPTSSFYDYNYVDQTPTVIVESSRADDYRYPTSRYDYDNSYGRSARTDYSYSSSPEYLQYDYIDNYPTSSKYSRYNDNHHYRSYDTYRYR